jgi:hypothetical protein
MKETIRKKLKYIHIFFKMGEFCNYIYKKGRKDYNKNTD